MIDKIYRNDTEGLTYAKHYKKGWSSSDKAVFGNSLKNAVDKFSLSEKSKMQNSYSDFLNKIGAEVNSENMQAVKSVEDRLQYFTNVKSKDVKSMAQMGFDIGKADDMSVYKAVQENKEKQQEDDDNVSMSLQEYGEKHPEIYNDIRLFKIAKALFSSGMVVTDYNIDKLVSVGDMLSKVDTLGNDDIVNFFKGDNTVNVENICTAKSIPASNNDMKLSKSEVDKLMPEIEKLFERESISKSDESIELARLFVENDIPVTKENIEKGIYLKNADFSDFYDVLAKAESRGFDCFKADIYKIGKVSDEAQKRLYANYIKISEDIKNINIAVLQKMYESSMEYTLKNISEMAQNYVSGTLNPDINSNTPQFTASADAVSAKRKIVEIQLRMTNEAMVRLSGKGIDITTSHIEDALNVLKQEERLISKDLLSVVGAEINEVNIKTLTQAMEVKEMLSNTAAITLFESSVIEGAAAKFNVNFTKIADTFENLELAPSAKYGDILPYNEESLSKLLQANGIEDTVQNRKAAEIISRNQMVLNEENILEIKTVNLKFEKIYNKLHPLTAAQMIKDGKNPLEMTLDDILEYIDNYNDLKGQNYKEKIAEYIVEAENSGAISENEKKAVTAIYRAFNMAESYGCAAIGLAVESGDNITIGDLLNSAKAFAKAKKVGFDSIIDDNFGILEGLDTNENYINNIVDNAVNNLNEREKAVSEYMDLLIERLIDVSAPNELVKFIRENNNFNKELLENMYAGLKEFSNSGDLFISQEKAEDLAQKIRSMNKGGKDVINWLTENNIPLTINNISSMAKLMADSFKSGSQLNEVDKREKEKGRKGIETEKAGEITFEDEEMFSEISHSTAEELEEIYENIIISEQTGNIGEMLIYLKELGLDIDLQNSFNREKGGAYQIPIRLSDGNITNLNMYALDNNDEKDGSFKGFMNIKTESAGTVGAYITVKNHSVAVKIKNDGDVDLSIFENELRSSFSENGFEDITINFYSDSKEENVFSNDIENTVKENAPQIASDINVVI